VTGHVSLVGAGPGDPDLLTVRAARRLAEADLVLYDALIAREARTLAPEARWFYVGKRAGRESISQAAINRLLVRAARRGFCVVRLKSGDPFVLGRGGEEALALVEAGIPFEVIPGVSSVLAAPGLAGIPLTHRGLASGFLVVSGHTESAYGPALQGLQPGSVTVVVLMGLGSRATIAAKLVERGWDPATPAAIVAGAATSEAWRWLGRLDGLASAEPPPSDAPGLLVIGAVAALAPTLQAQFGQLAASDVRRQEPGCG
jgi:uroporphyrin-III C-methyltransferase/precorrin-2 dehydrogenase/sirohydrochlorin ferrochelatase